MVFGAGLAAGCLTVTGTEKVDVYVGWLGLKCVIKWLFFIWLARCRRLVFGMPNDGARTISAEGCSTNVPV